MERKSEKSKPACSSIRDFRVLYTREGSLLEIHIPTTKMKILKKWLWADYMLYEHFKQKFLDTLSREKSFIDRNLNTFKAENEKVYSDCVISKTDNKNGLKGDFKMWSSNSLGYKINEEIPWCKYYAISEMAYTKLIRKSQKKSNAEENSDS